MKSSRRQVCLIVNVRFFIIRVIHLKNKKRRPCLSVSINNKKQSACGPVQKAQDRLALQ
jgi:hypothetical protein